MKYSIFPGILSFKAPGNTFGYFKKPEGLSSSGFKYSKLLQNHLSYGFSPTLLSTAIASVPILLFFP